MGDVAMRAYVLRRVLLFVPTVLGVATLVFFLIHMVPGDPVEAILGEYAQPAQKEALRHSLGLDAPLAVQYGRFLTGVATANLGESIYYRQPVTTILAERAPATGRLALAGMAVAIALAIPLGLLAAVKRGTWIDQGAMFFALAGISIPHFWLGPLLILAFAVHWTVFPASGQVGAGAIVLPAITLGTALAAMLSRMTRSSVLEVLQEDYVVAARARGLSEARVIGKHVLRNALIPVITILGLQFGALLSGAIVTEVVFAWPGLGTLLIRAIQSRDYPLVQGCILLVSTTYVVINLLTDLAYAWADPRIRYQ
jgi:peptide/nickel transport system permease protein